MDMLKILKHMSLSEKVVFKDTCRWLWIYSSKNSYI